MGARARGPLRGGPHAGRAARFGSGPRIGSSTSTAATSSAVSANGADARAWFRKALALNPQFSIRWSPLAAKVGRVVKRLALLGCTRSPSLVALVAPAIAAAHPLGNFTINRSAELELSGNRLYVSYVLDLAEIPTFQDGQAGIGQAAYLRRIERGSHVAVAGRPVRAHPGRAAARAPERAGRPADDALRGRLRRSRRSRARSPSARRRDLRGPDRLEGSRRQRGSRRLDRLVELLRRRSRSDRLRSYPKISCTARST